MHVNLGCAVPCCLFDLAYIFLPSFFISLTCPCTRGSSFFLGKVIALGVLCYFALLFV